ncbi:MAG TPA: glycosyltransferase family 1 protein [Sphingomicrobium sp.]|nr:glycosyltransferase family 1 protein [Sphingomicrobium sp.]
MTGIRAAAWLWRNRRAFGDRGGARPPRLLVDVSTIIRHDARTGIQRVVRAVWSELSQCAGEQFEAVPVFATHHSGYCFAPPDFLQRHAAKPERRPACVRPGDKFLGLDLSAHVLPRYRRQLRAWRANGATIHLVAYDLLPLMRPDWFNEATARNFANWFDVLKSDADQALCISNQVAQDLRAKIRGTATERNLAIGRLLLGGDIAASAPSAGMTATVSEIQNRVRFRPAILMVGTIEPRKGYDVALAAFEHLWRTRPSDAPDLIIVGKGGWKTSGLQQRIRSHPEQGKRLHWLDEVSDEALCQLYASSRALLMASHAEGFGLPLIEAAMYGRPILARDLAVFREQGLPKVTYFDDDRPAALAEKLLEVLQPSRQTPPAKLGLPAWSDCISPLLEEIGMAGDAAGPKSSVFMAAS